MFPQTFLLAFGFLLAVAPTAHGAEKAVQSEPFQLVSTDQAVMVVLKTDETFGVLITVANRLWPGSGLELRFYGEGKSAVSIECRSQTRDTTGRKAGLFVAVQLACLMSHDQMKAFAELPKARLELQGRASLVKEGQKILFEAKIRKKDMQRIAHFAERHLD